MGGRIVVGGVSVPMPRIAVACGHSFRADGTIVDGEDEGVCTYGVDTAGSVDVSVPGIVVASSNGGSGTMVYCKVQCGDRVAPCRIGRVVSRHSGTFGILRSMPNKAVASRHGLCACIGVVDG